MKGRKRLGVDIGATKTHIGLVQDGNIINELKFPTASQAPQEEIVADLIDGIQKLMDADILGIGIGVPGLTDEENGIVFDVQNIPSFKEVALKSQLEAYFNKPVYLTNDANTFVLGEKMYGQAKAYKNVVGLTLGSGLGTGLILNNNLYSGTFSSAGELGGIPYLDKTVEDYCSGKFFQQQFKMEGKDVLALAEKGDAHALEIFQQYGTHLGHLIKVILYALSPEAIFFGGSVSKSYEFFKGALSDELKSFPFKRIIDKLVIAPSDLTNPAVLGAAALVK
ncbi:MAG: ROK family protein [Fulvivirga sp.]